MIQNLFQRILPRLQPRKLRTHRLQLPPRFTQRGLPPLQVFLHALLVVGQRLQLHLPVGQLRLQLFPRLGQTRQVRRCALFVPPQPLPVTLVRSQVLFNLRQLVPHRRGFAQQSQHLLPGLFQALLAHPQLPLQLLALFVLGAQPVARIVGVGRSFLERQPVPFHIGFQRRQPLLHFLRFVLAARQTLLDRLHLLRLAIQAPTRPLGFNLQFGQLFPLRRQPFFVRIAGLLQRRIFGLFGAQFPAQRFKGRRRLRHLNGGFGSLPLQGLVLAGQQQAEVGHHLLTQLHVALGLGSLPLQRIHLPRHFFQNVEHARQVLLRAFQLGFRQTALRLEASNARRFFNHRAPVLRPRAQNLPDAPLLNNRVRFRAQARAHEDVLDVAQPRRLPVNQIFALARTVQTARHRNLVPLLALRMLGLRRRHRFRLALHRFR